MQTENSENREIFDRVLEKLRYDEYISGDEWESFCHNAADMNPMQLDQDSIMVRRYQNEQKWGRLFAAKGNG